jgi:cephalosporin-C deacetylase-like acetyl esterase
VLGGDLVAGHGAIGHAVHRHQLLRLPHRGFGFARHRARGQGQAFLDLAQDVFADSCHRFRVRQFAPD